ncbi:protein of unknown function [Shewanella benthica]|uniref:Uncharacterized protein n=1 Tax=Shewanella benthica TaxID=43661 RepID=A0A330LYD0_9GAMM|nr:protein of unknown function [Shewanella benthica]
MTICASHTFSYKVLAMFYASPANTLTEIVKSSLMSCSYKVLAMSYISPTVKAITETTYKVLVIY